MVNYALKGSFGLFDSSAETLDEFLACIRLYRPHRYWGLIHRITEHLRDKLVKVRSRNFDANSRCFLGAGTYLWSGRRGYQLLTINEEFQWVSGACATFALWPIRHTGGVNCESEETSLYNWRYICVLVGYHLRLGQMTPFCFELLDNHVLRNHNHVVDTSRWVQLPRKLSAHTIRSVA